MGQIEIYELLKNKRLGGDESYFSVREIYKMLKDVGYTNSCERGVRACVVALEKYKCLEVKRPSDVYDWKRTFRYSNNGEKCKYG